MDLLSSEHFHVLTHRNKRDALVFNRIDGTVATIACDDAYELENLKKVSTFCGPLVGVYLNSYIVIVKQKSLVGSLYEPLTKTEHEVYVIRNISIIPILNSDIESDLTLFSNDDCLSSLPHDSQASTSVQYRVPTGQETSGEYPDEERDYSLPASISINSYLSKPSKSKSWNFKLSSYIKTKQDSSSQASNYNRFNSHSSEFRKKLLDELSKLFVNSNSFYFSYTLDITCAISLKPHIKTSDEDILWKHADERFFWNRHMLKSLIELDGDNFTTVNNFIVPILQGFIQLEKFDVSNFNNNDSSPKEGGMVLETITDTISEQFNSIVGYIDKISKVSSESSNEHNTDVKLSSSDNSIGSTKKDCQIGLISRRSIFQAGTRYRRRGCNENGNCANFVETEQLFRYGHHQVSYMILRGSIPLYWSQPGFKYRPAPVLTRNTEDNKAVFSKHFQDLIFHYGSDITLVDCTEHTGRERVVHEAYKNHFSILNDCEKDLKFIEFDFHKLCKGRLLLHVDKQLTKSGIDEALLSKMRYYWHDSKGLICKQQGIFRVNCIDCLDRTNIVQRAIALQVLDLQLTKLGLLCPDNEMEENKCRKLMQLIWANNGDILSRQYAGSNALKGDFARTGERKLYGYLKDTYSSASRYYISKFRDAYRQAAIDNMLGNETASIESNIIESENQSSKSQTDLQDSDLLEKFEEIDEQERMTYILNDCKILIDEHQEIVSSWLLNCCDPDQGVELEVLFILTKDSYFVIDYDELAERINNFQEVKFKQIEEIEIGMSCNKSLFFRSSSQFGSLLRINYSINNQTGYFHLLKQISTSSNNSSNQQQDLIQVISNSLKRLIPNLTIKILLDQKLPKKSSIISGIVNENTYLMFTLNIKDKNSNTYRDNNTLIGSSSNNKSWLFATSNLEPLFSGGRKGTAALREVGSQLTNRFSSMRVKFYNRDSDSSDIAMKDRRNSSKQLSVKKSELEQQAEKYSTEAQKKGTQASIKTVKSSESGNDGSKLKNVTTEAQQQLDQKVNFSKVAENEEFYEDDDFTSEQVMLSLDPSKNN